MNPGPIVGGILDGIAGITKIVTDRIDEKRGRWTQLVAENPRLAALTLEMAAEDLEGSVAALPKWRKGAKRRRLAKAETLREQARSIRAFARGEQCERPMRRPV